VDLVTMFKSASPCAPSRGGQIHCRIPKEPPSSPLTEEDKLQGFNIKIPLSPPEGDKFTTGFQKDLPLHPLQMRTNCRASISTFPLRMGTTSPEVAPPICPLPEVVSPICPPPEGAPPICTFPEVASPICPPPEGVPLFVPLWRG
jgi:hypothetical protein